MIKLKNFASSIIFIIETYQIETTTEITAISEAN